MIHIDRLLETAIKRSATDAYLRVGEAPTLRVDAALRKLDTQPLDSDDMTRLVQSITPDRQQAELAERGHTRYCFAFGDAGRFRVTVRREDGGPCIEMRLIPARPRLLERTRTPPIVRALCRRPHGLIVVAGPAGGGKTSLLASMIDYINSELHRHIVILENPLEYEFTNRRSIIERREIGDDAPSYAEAIRRAVREQADVLLVGRLDQPETIEETLFAAAAGKTLVLAHVTARSAQDAIGSMVDQRRNASPADSFRRLSATLIAVLYQELCPRRDGGLAPALELLVVTPAISGSLERDGTGRLDHHMARGAKYGMRSFDDDVYALWRMEEITAETALVRARDFSAMMQQMGRGPDDDPIGDCVRRQPPGGPPGLSGHALVAIIGVGCRLVQPVVSRFKL